MRRQLPWKGGVALLLAAALAGGTLTGVLIYRARASANQRAKTAAALTVVCQRIHRLDVALQGIVMAGASRKQLLKTLYYREHPDEIPAAQAAARDDVRRLGHADCSPAELAGHIPPAR